MQKASAFVISFQERERERAHSLSHTLEHEYIMIQINSVLNSLPFTVEPRYHPAHHQREF